VVGEPLRFVLRAGGSPAPTYALVQAPAGMTVDPTTGELVWTPPAEMVGAVAVTVRATNSVGSVDYAFTIQVAATNPGATEIFLPLIAKSS
ncbi:MAG: putative Ig domain-containing protein, partial [Caldilineaceae bacterium]|nr:putative Ig domain-containing protein [Caldilineaceae bacterium]